jgi:hypothetical protein
MKLKPAMYDVVVYRAFTMCDVTVWTVGGCATRAQASVNLLSVQSKMSRRRCESSVRLLYKLVLVELM